MLAEAVAIIRSLWEGGVKSHHGRHYTVEGARVYTLPEQPPDIMVAAAGPEAAELARSEMSRSARAVAQADKELPDQSTPNNTPRAAGEGRDNRSRSS